MSLAVFIFLIATNLFGGLSSVLLGSLIVESSKMYVVVVGILVVFAGLCLYLLRLDNRIRRLRRKIEQHIANNTKQE